MSTWADLENGIRLDGAHCSSCGRATMWRAYDRIVRCDGCGETTPECLCPPARPLEAFA